MTFDGLYVFKPLERQLKKTSLELSFLSLSILNRYIQNIDRNQRPFGSSLVCAKNIGFESGTLRCESQPQSRDLSLVLQFC